MTSKTEDFNSAKYQEAFRNINNLKATIKIRKLTKTFGDFKAVD